MICVFSPGVSTCDCRPLTPTLHSAANRTEPLSQHISGVCTTASVRPLCAPKNSWALEYFTSLNSLISHLEYFGSFGVSTAFLVPDACLPWRPTARYIARTQRPGWEARWGGEEAARIGGDTPSAAGTATAAVQGDVHPAYAGTRCVLSIPFEGLWCWYNMVEVQSAVLSKIDP